MHRRGVAWLLAGAALLVCPTVAHGSIDAALQTFGGAWPQGCPQVTIERGSDPDPTVSGFATPGTCVVYLTPSFLAQRPDRETVCAVVVHEFGHLLGLGHSADDSDVMFPQPLPPAACLQDTGTASASASEPAEDKRAEEFHVGVVVGWAQPTTGSELFSGKRPNGKRGTSRRSRMCARATRRRTGAKSRSARSTRRASCKAAVPPRR